MEYDGVDTYFPMFSWSKDDIDQALSDAGAPLWDGYSRGFPRTACWMCPGQKPLGYAALRKSYPGLWRDLLKWEERLGAGHAWFHQRPFAELADKGESDLAAFLDGGV